MQTLQLFLTAAGPFGQPGDQQVEWAGQAAGAAAPGTPVDAKSEYAADSTSCKPAHRSDLEC